jgi:hypothetical protein
MQIAAVTLLLGIALNPVLGWVSAILVENLNTFKFSTSKEKLPAQNVKMTIIVSVITFLSYIVSIYASIN